MKLRLFLTVPPDRPITLLPLLGKKETTDWWKSQRHRFSLCVSDLVIEEAGRGDKTAARKRLAKLAGLEVLSLSDQVVLFSKSLIREGSLPDKALDDALHIAIAAVHGVDYLLTWNCRHIANAETKPKIRSICLTHRFQCPEIATPTELMGVNEYD